MGKYSSGLDWIDVETMMRAMSALHTGQVGLTVLPHGIGSSGGVSVGASIMFDVLPGSSIPPCVSVIKNWPCASHATFQGHCFALLHELDYEISKVYANKSLWE
jgi:hypothetical protein